MSRSTATDQSPGAHQGQTESPGKEGAISHLDEPSASGNLDKIRDILFGEQAREHDRRFAQLEQHLIREAADLRNDLKRRFETLELYIRKEVDALTGRLTTEQEMRGDSVTKLTKDLTQLAATLEEKAGQLEQQATHVQSHVLQQLMDRTSELATDVRARHAETTSALKQAVHDLRTEKTDRAMLAAILLEASKRLSGDETQDGQ